MEVVWSAVMPEIVLVGTGVLVLLLGALRPRGAGRPLAFLCAGGLLGAGWATVRLWDVFTPDVPVERLTVLGGMVAADRYALFFRLLILASALVAVLLSHHYLERTGEERGEFYALLLFATSGMTLLAAATDLIVVFLGLEVLSLSLYVMAGFSWRRAASQEASMKYFLLGAFSSAFFLYGLAMAYGATGTTNIAGIASALSGPGAEIGLGLVAAGLLTVGFAFKVAAVPFHMWTPDVYQGAPTPVTAFMAAGTKVAGFAALIRVTQVALGPLGWDVRPALWVLAALTMVVGSLLAIAQDDVKRMLAYSSVAHAGFVLVGVSALNQQGISGSMFYLVAYAAMIMGAFGVVILVSRTEDERTSLTAYRGLARRSPVLAALLALFLLSLAGIPPTAGFIAKVLVFQAAVDAGQWWLALVGVGATVIAAFFYIRLIVLAYMEDPREPVAVEAGPAPGWALVAAAGVTVLFGVLPSLVLSPIGEAALLRW